MITLDPERASIGLFFDVHAPVAFILKANRPAAVAGFDTKIGRECFRQWLLWEDNTQSSAIDGKVAIESLVDWELFAELETSVSNELGVYAAVTAVVDILEIRWSALMVCSTKIGIPRAKSHIHKLDLYEW